MTTTLSMSPAQFIASAGKLDTDKRYLFKIDNPDQQFNLPIGRTIGLNEWGFLYKCAGSTWNGTPTAYSPPDFTKQSELWGIGGVQGFGAALSTPITSDFTQNGTYNTTMSIGLSQNISGQWFAVELVTPPSNGTYSLNTSTGNMTYNSPNGGMDSFTFQAYGPAGVSNISTATLNVTEAPAATVPIANDFNVTIYTSGSFTLKDYNTGGEVTSATIVSTTTRGTLTLGLPSTTCDYHTTESTGTDSFTYTLSGPAGTSNVATGTITLGSGPIGP